MAASQQNTLLLYGQWFIFQVGEDTVGEGGSHVAGLVRMLRVWHRYNQNLCELNQLDDRELADIGITRCDFQRIAWEGARR